MLSRCTFFLENTLSVLTLREFGRGISTVQEVVNMLIGGTSFMENTLSVVTLREFGGGCEYAKWRHILE